MRSIGSKENLLGFIETTVAAHGFSSGVFCDLFAGTTTVGRHFNRKGFEVISNDLMASAQVPLRRNWVRNSFCGFYFLWVLSLW